MNRIFYKKIFKSIVLCLLKTHAMNIILRLWRFLSVRDAECRVDKITECMEISVENWYKCMWFLGLKGLRESQL